MTCSICQAPAHHVYAEGDVLQAYCSICDRIGAEDAPMESGRRVALVGAVLFLVLFVVLPIICGGAS